MQQPPSLTDNPRAQAFYLAVTDPDLELRRVRFCFACPAGFSFSCDFLFFTQNKGPLPCIRHCLACKKIRSSGSNDK